MREKADSFHAADIFCLHCGYCLSGSTASYCSECGARFDRGDPATFRFARPPLKWPKRFLTSPITAVLCLWAAVLFEVGVWTMALLIAAAVAWLLIWKRHRGAVCAMLLSPIVVLVAIVGVEYALGRAALHGQYVNEFQRAAIDPVHRTPRRFHTGCVRSSSDWFWLNLKDDVLLEYVRLFGPVPGTYLGPFPTLFEALAAAAGAPPIPADELLRDRVVCGDRVYQLNGGAGFDVLLGSEWMFAIDPDSLAATELDLGPIIAIEHPRGVLLVQVPSRILSSSGGVATRTFVIETARGRPITVYTVGCQRSSYTHLPSWK